MAAQGWYSNAAGAYTANNKLSKKLRTVGQPMFRFRQFSDPQQEYGRKNGKQFLFNRQGNLTTTLDGVYLSEGVPIPKSTVAYSQGTLTVYESGKAVAWSELFDSLSEIEVKEQSIVKSLVNDMAKQLDYRCYSEGANTADVCYIPTGTDANPTGTWDLDGTPSTTATRRVQVYDLKNWCDAFSWGVYGSTQYVPAPPWDGTNYVAVCSISALRSIGDDPEFEKANYYGDPEKLFSGEKGRLGGASASCRMVADNHISGRLSGAYSDECTVFAEDAVIEGVCTAEEVRDGLPGDHGRDQSSAWYYLGGWSKVWPVAAGDNRIIRVRSA